MKKHPALKKAVKITANVIFYIFIAVCILGVIMTITAKKDADGTVTVFGTQLRLVLSESMERCDATDVSQFKIKDIPMRSMIFIQVVPEEEAKAEKWYSDLEVGDVLTFKYVYVSQKTITHRITDIKEKPDGGYIIALAGDNKDSDSETLTQTIDTSQKNSPNYVIGKVVGQSYALGWFVNALRAPVGLICIVILPALLILIFEVIRMVNMLGEDKKKKEQAEKEKQQSELDALKRRLAELEAQQATATPTPTAAQDGGSEAPPGTDAPTTSNNTNGDVP